jgi:hypothetical protein
MIAGASGFDRLAARLTIAAERIARASAGRRAAGSTRSWRRAGLLWPLFTNGQSPFSEG